MVTSYSTLDTNLLLRCTWLGSAMAWSPDGKQMATAGMDKRLVIWIEDTSKTMNAAHQIFTCQDLLKDLSWSTNAGRSLGVIDVNGNFGIQKIAPPAAASTKVDNAETTRQET